ncbi:hypothetical protein BLA29_008804, partial [Euroglyphus maynei]
MFPVNYLYLSFDRIVGNLFASKIITHGLLYSFYDLDRCDPRTQISTVLLDYNIKPQQIFTDIGQLLIICIIIRLMTMICFIAKFQHWTLFAHSFKRSIDDFHVKPIDDDGKENHLKSYTIHVMKNDDNQRIKTENEMKFEKFSQDKFIIGWRSLSLFTKDPLYKLRSSKSVHPDSSELILRNLNGQFRFGTLNAVMGTSGAGKTSLLRVLNGQCKTRLSVESEFYLSRYT